MNKKGGEPANQMKVEKESKAGGAGSDECWVYGIICLGGIDKREAYGC